MNDNTLSRRELLRMGGLTVVGATFLAEDLEEQDDLSLVGNLSVEVRLLGS